MNNEQKKIIGYDPNTGQPIYEQRKQKDGLGIASMVIGIIAIFMSVISFMLILPLSVVGLALGYSSTNKQGKAKVGIILNFIALGLLVVEFILLMLTFAFVG